MRKRGVTDLFWFYGFLGAAFSVAPLVSLAQKMLEIGLAPVMEEIVENYRSLVHPIVHWLLEWTTAPFTWLLPDWSLQAPDWLKDLYALSFVGGAAGSRALWRSEALVEELPVWMLSILTALGGVVFGGTFFGLIAILVAVVYPPISFLVGDVLDDDLPIGLIAVQVWGALAMALIFFAINSQL